MALPGITAIRSERVTLRPVQPDDLTDLMAVNGDPDVTRFLPYATWQTADDGVAWLRRMSALASTGTAQQLVIVRNVDRKVIGTALLFRFEAASSRVELGFVVGREHWRQGYARETLAALLGHAFEVMAIRRVEAEVHIANLPSNALLRSLGFVHEGVLRERWVAKGAAYSVHIYGLLASEWRAS